MKRRNFVCGLAGIGAAVCLGVPAVINTCKRNNNKDTILKFGITINSHCNLNCVSCDAFAPLSEENFLDIKQLEYDLEKLKKIYNTNAWNGFYTGGEPLLHPDLEKIIEKTFKILPRTNLAILTNAVLLNSKDESFWKLLQKYNVALRITKYPVNIERRIYEERAKNHNIRIIYNDETSDKLYDLKTKKVINNQYNHKARRVWGKPLVDIDGKQDPVEKFKNCEYSRGFYIYKYGNLYLCRVHAVLKIFADYFKLDIPINKEDYLNIASIKSKSDIDDFLSKPNALCRFCKPAQIPIDWNFSERKITEWIET